MNPNANSFNFSAGAGSFVPRGAPGQGQQGQQYQGYDQYSQQQGQPYGAPGGAGYYQQYQGQQPYDQGAGGQGNYYQQYNQQQQYYGGYNQHYQPQQPQQGAYRAPHQRNNAPPSVQAPVVPASQSPSHNLDSSASAAGVQDNWDDEDPVAPAPTPAASKPAPQGKTISLGAPKPAAAETPKASSISISIGGKKVQEPKAEEQKPKEAAAAPAASTSSAAKLAASASPAKTTPSATPAPAAASSAAKKAAPAAASASKQADKEAGPTAGSVKTADEIADQIASAAAEDELKDLFGVSADGKIDGKEHINVVFIGHVDAGKSTMGGQILVQSGMVDKRTLEKYEKDAKEVGRDSWYLSYALDSTPQERNQGKTVEVGRAYFETEKRRYTILDAPGHKSFVPAMISGAAQADVAILVISARKGEFEAGFDKGGQTREHIVLVKTAGVSRLVIAINKMDEPTVQWDKARYDEIVGKLTPFLKGTGYNPKTDVTIMPVSGQTGLGIKDRIDTKICPWYNGPSLLEHLDTMAMANRNLNAPFMMPISEKYKDMGTIVVGKIESGRVKRGDTVTIMPNKNQVEITAIYAESEEEVPYAMCGDNVRFRLRGIDDEDISIGYVVSDAKKPVHAVQLFEAQLIILEHKNIICAGYSAVMHVHTAAEEITLSALLHYYDKKTGRKSKRPPQFAKKGQKIIALVEAAGPVCIEKYDDYQQLGRFTLRDEGRTIAIGKVTKLIEKSDDMPNVAGMNLGGIAGQVAASAPSNGA